MATYREASYAELLANPCDAMPQSFYPGETGIVNRFVQDFVINNVAGHTCGIIVYNPGGNQVQTASGPTSSVAITPTTNPGPGGTFLGVNATKSRALAACTTIIPSAVSMTNITGEIAVGIISADTVINVPTIVNNVFTLCQKRAVLAKTQYDIKWSPGALDHTYNTLQSTGPSSDQNFSDANAIVVAYRGFPAGTELSVRLTGVIEWTPDSAYQGAGLSTSSTSNFPVDVGKVTSILSAKQPNWWHNLGTELSRDVSIAAKYVSRGVLKMGANSLLSYAQSAVPRVLSGLGTAALLTM
jgi:hypothetical protein